MTDTRQTTESAASGEQNAGGQKIRSRKNFISRLTSVSKTARINGICFYTRRYGGVSSAPRRFRARAGWVRTFGLVAIVVVLLVGPAVWAGYVYLKLLRAPVTLPQPHDHQAALRNILELQALALTEAEAGRPAYFVSHIGCASPPVWHDERVLQNLRRMVDARVEVKLIGGLAGHRGEPLPSAEWPTQFKDKLKDLGIASILRMRKRELPNHSAVASSGRRALAYICISEERYIYPTKYFKVRDNEACQQWKNYLLRQFQVQETPAGDNPPSRSQ